MTLENKTMISFNQTRMELKPLLDWVSKYPDFAFNQTRMELKHRFLRPNRQIQETFNQTRMELKQRKYVIMYCICFNF